MADIIIAFPKLDDAKNLRKLLVRNGYDVNMVCDSGAQIVSAVNSLDGGIVISGYNDSSIKTVYRTHYLCSTVTNHVYIITVTNKKLS